MKQICRLMKTINQSIKKDRKMYVAIIPVRGIKDILP